MADVKCYGDCNSEHTGAPNDEESRRWCHECSEWCYPSGLCTRGAVTRMVTRLSDLRDALLKNEERDVVQELTEIIDLY